MSILVKKQLFKNTVWSLSDFLLYPLLMIVATPLFIKHLGYEQYGIWMVATTINQFMNAFNFGLGDVTIKTIASNRALNNADAIIEQVNKNWSLAILICFTCSIVGCLLAFSGIINFWFHIPESFSLTAKWVLGFVFIATSVKFLELVLLSVFKGFERFDVSAQLSIVSRNSIILVNMLLVVFGAPLEYIFLSTVIVSVLNIVTQWLVVKSTYPFLQFFPKFKVAFAFENKQQYWYWLQSVIGLVGFLSDRILVGYFTNLKVLGLYSVAVLIGSQIHNAVVGLGSFMFPKVAYENALNNSVLPIYYKSRFILAALGWCVCLAFLITGSFIFKIWLGLDFYTNSIAYINLYLVFTAFILLNIIPYQFINGSNFLKYNSLMEGILRASNLLAMLVGFYFFNVIGVIWGLIISTAINMPFQYFLLHRLFFGWKSIVKSISVILPPLCFILFVVSTHGLITALSILLLLLSIYFIYLKPSSLFSWKKK